METFQLFIFQSGRAKDLSVPLYYVHSKIRKFGNHTIPQKNGIQIIQWSIDFTIMLGHTPRCAKKGILVLMEQHSAGVQKSQATWLNFLK